MNQIASLALLVLGIALLAMGWDAYRSVSSDVARVFTGAPTDRALLLLVAGSFSASAGLGGLARGRR